MLLHLLDFTINLHAIGLPSIPPWLAQCPWHQFPHPAPQFCEADRCGWIRQPANAWSSLAYSLGGIWLCWDRRQGDAPLCRLLGPIAILLGGASFAYHAAYTLLTQFFDLLSMFLLSNLVLTLTLTRAGIIHQKHQILSWLTSVAISIGALYFSLSFGRTIFGIEIAATFICELYLRITSSHRIDSSPRTLHERNFAAIIVLFLSAFLIWNLDLHKIICDPTNHILQGHAIWHILTAACFIFIHRFYAPSLTNPS